MKISDYVKTKDVTLEELETHFKKVREVQINEVLQEGCYSCGGFVNVDRLRAGAWLIGRYCRNCNSINLIYPKSLAGKVERVMIYKERFDK
jgi:ribosomal protein L37AE/L43A